MDNLILTGWFWKDYAVAAAVALRHYKKADIYGVSTHRLPEMLNEVCNKYKEIAILGVGLSGDAELLEKALTKLQKNGVHVRNHMTRPKFFIFSTNKINVFKMNVAHTFSITFTIFNFVPTA